MTSIWVGLKSPYIFYVSNHYRFVIGGIAHNAQPLTGGGSWGLGTLERRPAHRQRWREDATVIFVCVCFVCGSHVWRVRWHQCLYSLVPNLVMRVVQQQFQQLATYQFNPMLLRIGHLLCEWQCAWKQDAASLA